MPTTGLSHIPYTCVDRPTVLTQSIPFQKQKVGHTGVERAQKRAWFGHLPGNRCAEVRHFLPRANFRSEPERLVPPGDVNTIMGLKNNKAKS